MSNTNNNPRDRRVRIRAVHRAEPDLRKLSRALIDLALAQAQAEADAQAEHEHPVEIESKREQEKAKRREDFPSAA